MRKELELFLVQISMIVVFKTQRRNLRAEEEKGFKGTVIGFKLLDLKDSIEVEEFEKGFGMIFQKTFLLEVTI